MPYGPGKLTHRAPLVEHKRDLISSGPSFLQTRAPSLSPSAIRHLEEDDGAEAVDEDGRGFGSVGGRVT